MERPHALLTAVALVLGCGVSTPGDGDTDSTAATESEAEGNVGPKLGKSRKSECEGEKGVWIPG